MAGELVLDAERSATTPATSSWADPGQPRRAGCWPTPWTGPVTRSTRCGSATSRAATDLPEEVPGSYYGGAWTADSGHFFYTVLDAAYRPHEVWRHAVGTPVSEDVLVLSEPDERFELNVRASRSGGLVLIWSASRDTTEVWVLDAHDPRDPPRSVGGRRVGVEYHAEHAVLPDGTEVLLLVTNDEAQEFRLAQCPVPRAADQDHHAWRPVRDEDPDERLERVDAFGSHAVLSLRSGGRHRLRLLSLDGAGSARDGGGPGLRGRHRRPRREPRLRLDRGHGLRPVVRAASRLVATSTSGPAGAPSGTGSRRPAHDPDRYLCGAPAPSPRRTGPRCRSRWCGTGDTPLDGTAPALLYGYGAYEYDLRAGVGPGPARACSTAASCSPTPTSAAAARAVGAGGSTAGWPASRTRSPTTSRSPTGCAGLVDGHRHRVPAASAPAACSRARCFSQRPDRWRGGGRGGAVRRRGHHDARRRPSRSPSTSGTSGATRVDGRSSTGCSAYSPYDNLPPAGGRPDLLVTGALHDPRVMVHEPAKWVAALRETDPEWSPRCLFRVETGAGAHDGPSGRYGPAGLRGRRSTPGCWTGWRSLTRQSVAATVAEMIRTTPFHARLSALNTQGLYTHWQGHLSALRYTHAPKHEYFAVRNGVGVFDTSPLFKYRIQGPDAERFLAGVLARDIRTCRPGSGPVHPVVRRPRLRDGGRRRASGTRPRSRGRSTAPAPGRAAARRRRSRPCRPRPTGRPASGRGRGAGRPTRRRPRCSPRGPFPTGAR